MRLPKIGFVEFGEGRYEMFDAYLYKLSSKIWFTAEHYTKTVDKGLSKIEYVESEWGFSCYIEVLEGDPPCTLVLKGDMLLTDTSDKAWFLHRECEKLAMVREGSVKQRGI